MSLQSPPSRIDAVTVYRLGARVRRSVEVEASAAGYPDEVRVTDLPLSLDDDSVRVRMEALGDADTTALPEAADLRIVLDVPLAGGEKAPPKDEELEEARIETQKIAEEVERIRETIDRIESLAIEERPKGKRGDPPSPSPTDARLSLMAFRREEIERRREELRGREKTLVRAGEILDELTYRHAVATSARQAREHELRKTAVVRLRAPEGASLASHARMVVEYLIPGARWAPSYAVRFDTDFHRARLQIRAMVAQRCGEDWTGVDLSLSTADAMAWTELPELPSLRIGRRQSPPARPGWREPPEGAQALFSDWDRAKAASPSPQSPPAGQVMKVDALQLEEGSYDEPETDDDGMFGEEMEVMECLAEEPSESALPCMAASAAPPPAPRKEFMKKEKAIAMPRRSSPQRSMASPAGAGVEMDGLHLPAPEEAEEDSHISASAELLRFGRLRMAGPGEAGRGTLQPLSDARRYQDLLADMEIEVPTDLGVWIRRASRLASNVSSTPAPGGHLVSDSIDGFDYTFCARRPVDVPSDGAFHSLSIAEEDAETSLRYVVVPREGSEVFRFVTFKNPLDSPLLAGPADIYVGGDFILTSPMKTSAPLGDVEIGLGVEEGIKVARNSSFEEHASGLLGGRLGLEHRISIDLSNQLKRPVDVEVRERLPSLLEGEEEIEMEIGEIEPPWEEWKQVLSPIKGSYRWKLRLDAGAERSLSAKYTISLSSKKKLSGGNRREA